MGFFDSFLRLWNNDAADNDAADVDDDLETQLGLGPDEADPDDDDADDGDADDGDADEGDADEIGADSGERTGPAVVPDGHRDEAAPSSASDGDEPGVFGRIGRFVNDRYPDRWDNDKDGLSDELEIRHGFDPDDADSDGDGWDDGDEVVRFTDPLDDDGHPIEAAATRNYGTDRFGVDMDDDGLSDTIEARLGGHDERKDTNRDGIDDAKAALNGLSLDSVAHDKPWPPGGDIADASLNEFLYSAIFQTGDAFRMGAEAGANEANPDEWDSSELVQWAARQGGVDMVDGSWKQFQQVSKAGGEIDVDVALTAPGALLFRFSGDPMGSRRPPISHVAISLGDGRVIEATEGGVRVAPAGDRFTHAGVIRAFEQDEMFDEGFFAADLNDILARLEADSGSTELQPGEDLIELEPDDQSSPDLGDADLSGFDVGQMLDEPASVVDLAPPVTPEPLHADPVATSDAMDGSVTAIHSSVAAIDGSVDDLFDPGFASNSDWA